MGDLLTPLDIVIFFGSLMAVMAAGLWTGRKEDTAEDYYLAGRQTPWWGVAASIFGSNVSANHIVGMMGIGFSIGFAQSHFEISAIAGLLLMCYGFLPIYRRLNVYTLSEYLEHRYNDSCRLIYALITVVIIVVIQMVPAFYIGSRSLNILLQGGPGPINANWYVAGIVVMAVVTGTYTIFGGLKAVIMTDVLQSILMLIAGLVVAFFTFSQPEIAGWQGMVALDAASNGAEKLHLYRPSDHPDLPWSGVLIGLMVLHFNYWGTNQFIVQRALSAKSDQAARFGIIFAGFLKLLIPFYSIGAGIAAFYLLPLRGLEVAPDAVFTTLLTELVAPVGFGLIGIVAAGLIGAILSSVDSMMNSAATIITFDIYQRYIDPQADERRLIWIGRVCIFVFVVGGALLAMFIMDPNSQDNFFLQIAKHQTKIVVGVVVAFGVGMLWQRATSAGALAAILSGIGFGFFLPWCYEHFLASNPTMVDLFGEKLNFMHAASVTAVLSTIVHVVVSLMTQADPEKGKFTWTGLGIYSVETLRRFWTVLAISLAIYVLFAFAVLNGLSAKIAGWVPAAWTWSVFGLAASRRLRKTGQLSLVSLVLDDAFVAGLLAATAIFMMYFFA